MKAGSQQNAQNSGGEFIMEWLWLADLLRRIKLQNETYAFFSTLNSHSLVSNEILTCPVWQSLKLHVRLTQRTKQMWHYLILIWTIFSAACMLPPTKRTDCWSEELKWSAERDGPVGSLKFLSHFNLRTWINWWGSCHLTKKSANLGDKLWVQWHKDLLSGKLTIQCWWFRCCWF